MQRYKNLSEAEAEQQIAPAVRTMAERAVELASGWLGLDPAPSVRWFAPAADRGKADFEHDAWLGGHVEKADPSAIWLNVDNSLENMVAKAFHETFHAAQIVAAGWSDEEDAQIFERDSMLWVFGLVAPQRRSA